MAGREDRATAAVLGLPPPSDRGRRPLSECQPLRASGIEAVSGRLQAPGPWPLPDSASRPAPPESIWTVTKPLLTPSPDCLSLEPHYHHRSPERQGSAAICRQDLFSSCKN